MVALCSAASIAAVLKGSCDPNPAPLGAIISHLLASAYHAATIYEITSV